MFSEQLIYLPIPTDLARENALVFFVGASEMVLSMPIKED